MENKKVAFIYSICGVHEATLDSREGETIIKLSDADHGIEEDEGSEDEDQWARTSAYTSIAKIEVALRERNITHCADVVDEEKQEEPLNIDKFFQRWRDFIRETWE